MISRLRPCLDNPLFLLSTLLMASAFILATAWAYEILGGYTPCPLCLQERWAYYFALIATPASLWAYKYQYYKTSMLFVILILMGFLANTGLGAYHAGVEWKFWPGPSTCGGAGNLNLDGNLIDQLKDMKVIRCDQAAWRFLGLSFAGYNAIFSFFLTLIAAYGLIRTQEDLKKS